MPEKIIRGIPEKENKPKKRNEKMDEDSIDLSLSPVISRPGPKQGRRAAFNESGNSGGKPANPKQMDISFGSPLKV